MKQLKCSEARDQLQKTIYSCGEFSYEYIPDFCKELPGNLRNLSIAGGCTDPDGNVYLAARGIPSQIIQMNPEGEFVKAFGRELNMGDHIHFIYYTPDHTLLVADTNHHVIREITTEGEQIRYFGNMDRPSDTGMDMGFVMRERKKGIFPTEPCNTIPSFWIMLEGMKRVARVGEPFNMPTDAGMTSDGSYIFADGYGNRAIHKFRPDGTYETTWGGVGEWNLTSTTPGKFLVMHAVAVDHMDRVWVCDREKDAVHVLDQEGNTVGYCSTNMGQPSGVDADDKYIYVVGRAGYLTIFDLDLNIAAQLGTFNSDLRAHDIAVDRKGNLFLFPTHANEDHQVIQLKRI